MDIEKLYTIELKKVLTYVAKDILNDYPSKKITTEHFLLSLLSNKQCTAYKILDKIVSSTAINAVYDFYAKNLHEKIQVSTVIKKDANIGYDATLSKYLTKANDEKEKLDDPKIGTEHIFLAIMSENTLIAKQFNAAGITYDKFRGEITDSKSENDKVVADTINGFKSKGIKKNNGIETYCINVNKLAQQGKIDDLVGRESEMNRIIKIIGRRNKNNVIFVGLSGVGKTAMSYGLAKKIEQGNAMFLNGKTIWALNTTAIIAGTTYRGMFEERMNSVITELKSNKDYILFIDDIHNVLSSSSNNSSEMAGILSSALSDGDIQLIATTTFKEYKNTIESNPTLSRRFQKIIIDPSTVDETEKILFNSKSYYEKYHNVKYTDEAIKACVYLANKYITERQLPDSAIDIMDECGSEKKVYNPVMDELVDLKKDLTSTENLRDKSYKINDFKLGDTYKVTCKEIQSKIIDFEKKIKNSEKNNAKEINEKDIYNTVSEMINVPLNKLSTSEKQKYLNIENILNSKIIGQEEAIKKVSQTIRRNRIGLGRKNKPIGVFLCIGESGVGKTLLAKKLAEEIYGGENYLIRFDMSEFSDKSSVSKLCGSNPGYIGFEQGGQLTEAIKNKKHCVLLLDEIEKADKEVYNVFLQVFDDGILTDNIGQKISFNDTIILMTSNVGAKLASEFSRGAGFTTNIEDNKKSISEKALKGHFPPEFLNRLDDVLYFNHLSGDNLKNIIKLEIDKLNNRLNEINYRLDFNKDDLIEYLFNIIIKDNSPGARKINRIIQTEIEDRICDLYLKRNDEKNYSFKIEINDNSLIII